MVGWGIFLMEARRKMLLSEAVVLEQSRWYIGGYSSYVIPFFVVFGLCSFIFLVEDFL